MWGQAGIQTTVSEIEQVTFIDNLVTGKFQAYTDEMFGAPDPDLNYVWLSPTTANGPIALNFARNKDDALEAALQQGPHHVRPRGPGPGVPGSGQAPRPRTCPYLWASLATWSLTGSNSVQNFNNLTLPDGSKALGFANGVLDPTPDLAQGLSAAPPMLRFIANRLVQLVVICFLISVFAFLLVHLLPGDPTLAILGPNDTPAARAVLLNSSGSTRASGQQYSHLDHQHLPRQPGRVVPDQTDGDQRPRAWPCPSTSSSRSCPNKSPTRSKNKTTLKKKITKNIKKNKTHKKPYKTKKNHNKHNQNKNKNNP